MVRKIIWTKNAKEDFKQVVEYLHNEWSERIALNFIASFYAKIVLIDKLPQIGIKVENHENVNRILITKHNILYYIVNEKEIVLLDLLDTRQDPEKDKFRN